MSKWLAREDHILSNPASELELPRPEKRLPALMLTAEEAEAIMAMPDVATPPGLRDRAILELLYATAIRRSELVNLKIHDVDYPRAMLIVRKGKGNKDRVVPLGERATVWLVAYRDRVRAGLVAGRARCSARRRGRRSRIERAIRTPCESGRMWSRAS